MAAVRASNEPLDSRTETGDVTIERLRHLQAVTEAALAHLSLDDLLDELLERVRSILEADTAAVLLLDERTEEIVARAAKGLEEEVERGVRIPLGAGFAGRVAAERRAVFLPHLTKDQAVSPILLEKGVHSLLGVPLIVEGRVLGVLHVGTLTPREFTDSDAELLQLAADRVALAIDHVRLYEAERAARTVAERTVEQIRQLQSITDVALGHFSLDQELLNVLDRVREVLATDTAAVLLLDADAEQLVARAATGLEEEVERGVRIPVGGGFAGRIAAERGPVVLTDVDHADVLNPLLREKGIRSLLGVPLIVEGRVIGVLHVGTLQQREFSADAIALLELAADRIAIAIDRARQHNVAAVLQRSLLPVRLPNVPGLDVAARYMPGADDAHVGGDWYDLIPLVGGSVGIVMGDVVSRGLRAAAAMGHFRTALRAYARDGDAPGAVLERLNDLVRSSEEREMATIAYVVLDPETGEIAYTLAGHPPPLVLGERGETRFLDGGRAGPVGVAVGAPFGVATDALRPGDTLLLYTDGLIERRGVSLDESLAHLELVAGDARRWPDELCEHLTTELGDTSDDVAVLAVRLAGDPGERLELRVRAVPESLSAMRRSLSTWLAHAGAGEDDAYDMLVAVGEAAANAVEHAYGPVDEEFELSAEAVGGVVHFTIADHGRWRPARGENRGRGIDLMRQLVDEVEVDTREEGTVVRMRRRLQGEDG